MSAAASAPDSGDAAAIMAYVRAVASPGTESIRCGPFMVKIAPQTASPHYNYAVPDDGVEPSAADIAALVTLFDEWRRHPRLEYVPLAAPGLAAALLAAGFHLDHELPLMVCGAATRVELALPEGVWLVHPGSDDELMAMAAVQQEAFGEPPPVRSSDLLRRRESLLAGAILLAAMTPGANGKRHRVAGAGMAAPAHAAAREIVGVAVAEPWRRRGIAGAMVSALAGEAFATECRLIFLEAAPGAGGAYERAGFRTSASVAHYSR